MTRVCAQAPSRRCQLRQHLRQLRARRRLLSTYARFETTCEAYVAGIPVAPSETDCGRRLRHCLRERPHEFVPTALRELKAGLIAACCLLA